MKKRKKKRINWPAQSTPRDSFPSPRLLQGSFEAPVRVNACRYTYAGVLVRVRLVLLLLLFFFLVRFVTAFIFFF